MKIESIFTDQDGYKFQIDDVIVLKIAKTAISALKIVLPKSIYVEEYYKIIKEQFDIKKMIFDLLNKKDKINKISIDSNVCRVDGEIIFQTEDLKKYKK